MAKPYKLDINKLKKELAKYGIYTEEDLDKALESMEIDIGCMAGPINHEDLKEVV